VSQGAVTFTICAMLDKTEIFNGSKLEKRRLAAIWRMKSNWPCVKDGISEIQMLLQNQASIGVIMGLHEDKVMSI
jgi:hypothetical protein